MGGGVLNIVIVHEQAILRRALRAAIQVAFPAARLSELPLPSPKMLAHPVDIAVMGIYFSKSEIKAERAVAAFSSIGVRVVALVVAANARTVVELVDAGALGIVDAAAAPRELARAVSAVQDGELHVSSVLALALLSVAPSPTPQRTAHPGITEREKEVLAHVAQGFTDRQIGEELYISLKTVHSHLDRIRDKLGLRRRSELATYAVETGLASSFATPRWPADTTDVSKGDASES